MEKLAYLIIGACLSVIVMTFLPMAQLETNAPPAKPAQQTAKNMQGTEANHTHPPREVSTEKPIPSVSHLMFPDPMGGFNIQVLTRNFTFTPASINRAPQDNQGHAHIYVNDVKVARLYSPWFHLSGAFFKPGKNQVRVTLNANDHGEWAQNGQAISSVVNVVIPKAK